MLVIFLVFTVLYCMILSFSWYNAIGYINYPHSEDFDSLLIVLAFATTIVLMFTIALSNFMFYDRNTTTNIRITEVAKVGNRVTVNHNNSEITKVNINNVKISRNNQDYVKVTDSQKIMNSKIMQAIKGSKIGDHDKTYTVYLGNKSTLNELGIKVHKSNK